MSLADQVDTNEDVGPTHEQDTGASEIVSAMAIDPPAANRRAHPAGRIRRLERQLVEARVEALRLRADLETARARAGRQPMGTVTEADRREAEDAADRVADRIETISPVTAVRIREESGSNARLRFESAARATQHQLDAAHSQADRIQRRAKAHARKIVNDSRRDASAHAPQVFEMVALQAEIDAANMHEAAIEQRDEAIGQSLAITEAAAVAVRVEAQQAAERIVGQAYNRSSSIIADAKMRAEIIIAGAMTSQTTLTDINERIDDEISATDADVDAADRFSAEPQAAIDDETDDDETDDSDGADNISDRSETLDDDTPLNVPTMIRLTDSADAAPGRPGESKRSVAKSRRWLRSASSAPAAAAAGGPSPLGTTTLEDTIEIDDDLVDTDLVGTDATDSDAVHGWKNIGVDDDTQLDPDLVDLDDASIEVPVQKTFAALWTKTDEEAEEELTRFFGDSETADADSSAESVEAPF